MSGKSKRPLVVEIKFVPCPSEKEREEREDRLAELLVSVVISRLLAERAFK